MTAGSHTLPSDEGQAPFMDNPFPGLRPFQQEDDYLFFGREDQTMELLQRLGDHRFVAVVGSSGSGKSSLVRCGLLSELQGGKMLRAGSAWEIVVTHPGGNPLALLADACLDADLYDREEPDCREQLLATLSRSHFGLVEAVRQARLPEGTNFLLVVDQFEEIFRFHEAGQIQQEAANEFICLLLEAVRQADIPIYIVLTMRSDFIGDCGRFEGLAEMVSRGEFLIPRLTREQYKRVIEGPIRVAGGKITPRLLQRLLNDLGQQADQLPCLQHALMRSWSLWAERGASDTLDLEDYQRVGRMSRAMSLHADEVYDSLADDRQRQLCQGLFQALTVQESESRGIRRPQRLGALCQILDAPVTELIPVIDAYRRRGVTFLMPSPEVELTENTIVDISHESLMRVWTRLRHWVEEEAQAVGVFLRLSESAELHQQGQAGLYRDPELGIALSWRDARRPNKAWGARYHPGFDGAMRYLEASRQASLAEEQAQEAARQRQLEQARKLAEAEHQRAEIQRRAAGRLRGLAAGIAVVAVVALIASIAAFYAKLAADRANAAAQQSAEAAKRSADDAQREAQRATDSEAVAVAAQDALRQTIFSSDMNLTEHAYEAGNVNAMSDLLLEHVPAAGEPDPRGIEWYLWWNASHQEADIVHQGGGHLLSVALSRDGALAADSSWPNNIRLREAAHPHKVKQWSVPGAGEQRWLSFSPDGEMLAAVDASGRVQRFRTRDAQSLGIVRAPVFLRGLAFSLTQMASGGANGHIYLWDTSSWARSDFAASSQSLPVWSLSYSPDGQLLAVGTDGGRRDQYAVHGDSPLILWDTAAHSVRQTAAGHTARINSVAWSPDGEQLASGSADATVRVWTKDLETVQILDTSLSPVSDVAFSPNGRFLAAGTGRDNAIRVWSTATWELVTTIKGHSKPVADIAFDPRRGGLWSASEDATLKIWDVERSLQQPVVRLADQALVAMLTNAGDAAVGSDGRTLFCGREGAPLERYDLEKRTVLPLWGKADMRPATMSDDCAVLITIDNGLLRVWRTDEDQQPVAQVQLPADDSFSLHAAAVSRDGSLVAWMAGNPLHLGLFNCRTGETRQASLSLSGRSGWRFMRVSHDGRLVFVKNQFSAQVLDVGQFAAGTAPAPTARRHSSLGLAMSLAFSADGKLLAAPSWDSVIHLDDLESGRRLRTLTGHSARVLCAVFSRDRRRLLSGSEDGTVRVWDVETGDSLTTLKGHRGAVTWVGFGRDESEIISVSRADGAVQIWHAINRNDLEQSVPYWSGLAWRDEHAGRYAEAITAYDRAVLLAPDDADLRRRRGALLAKLDQDDAAVRDFVKLVALGAADEEVLQTAKAIAQRRALTTNSLSRPTWRYTFQQPPANWAQADFDATSWELGTAPFGNRDTDATQWISDDIWLRCEFESSAPSSAPLLLDAMCDDDAEFYLNGVPAAEGHYDRGRRQTFACAPKAAATLRPGRNILAVHCRNRQGFAAIDAVLFVSSGLQKWIDHLNAALDEEPGNVNLLAARLQALQEDGGGPLVEAEAATMQALREAVSADLKSADVFWPTSAELLADMLLMEFQSHESENWRILDPIEMNSAGGAALTRLPDGSILASGKNPDSDLYEIVAETDLARVTALRIEALTHESLPIGGPGRDGKNDLGNFALNELRIASSPRTEPDQSSPVRFAKAWTDHTNGTLQDVLRGHWNTGGGGGRPHEAIWRLLEPISHEEGVRLTFHLQFQQAEQWPGQNLGRFRLSVSSDPAAFERHELARSLRQSAFGWSRLAAAYYLVDDVQGLDELLAQRPQLAASVGDLHAAAEDWQRALSCYNRLVSPDGADAELLAKRGLAYAALGKWDDALADWRAAALREDVLPELVGRLRLERQWRPAAAVGQLLIEQDPTDRMRWLRTAPTLVLAGDEQGYREFCSRMAEQFADTTDPFEADVACKSCLLAPGAVDMARLPLSALAGPLDAGTAPQNLRPWGWACRALAAYRSGDVDQAARYLQEAANNAPVDSTAAMIRALRALVRHQRGDSDGARAALRGANTLIDRELPNANADGIHDWLIPLILVREAEKLLSEQPAGADVGPAPQAPPRRQPPLEEL